MVALQTQRLINLLINQSTNQFFSSQRFIVSLTLISVFSQPILSFPYGRYDSVIFIQFLT